MENLNLGPDPIAELLKWYHDAVQAGIKNPDAMTLATATRKGIPSARIVLFKGTHPKGIRFFTNYTSRKGKELKSNPHAAVVFYWAALDRQIRIEGKIKRLSKAESEAYWNSRPIESQLSGAVSPQSQVISGREVMEKKIDLLIEKLHGKPVPKPAHWGGFCLIPQRVEFWISGEGRFHDRFSYTRSGKKWKVSRLAP